MLGCAGAQVMQMFDKAESEFRELSDKRSIVENDKSKIQKVICLPATVLWCDRPGPVLVEMEAPGWNCTVMRTGSCKVSVSLAHVGARAPKSVLQQNACTT